MDTNLKPEDKVFEDKGVKIVVDRKSFLYLVGTELDYTGGLNGKGFSFNNPNASRTCSCGDSFCSVNSKMSGSNEILEELTSSEYKYGFTSNIDSDVLPPGLTEDTIRFISAKKSEPEFMLEYRLKAFRIG